MEFLRATSPKKKNVKGPNKLFTRINDKLS